MGSERHYQAFAGEKYEKLINSKFSIFTFLFGPHYWAYRKMLVQALILLIIEIIAAGIAFFVYKDYTGIAIFFGVTCAIQLIASFVFGSTYKKFVEKSVDKIIESDATDSEFEEIESCSKRGGTSIVYAFLAAISKSEEFIKTPRSISRKAVIIHEFIILLIYELNCMSIYVIFLTILLNNEFIRFVFIKQ